MKRQLPWVGLGLLLALIAVWMLDPGAGQIPSGIEHGGSGARAATAPELAPGLPLRTEVEGLTGDSTASTTKLGELLLYDQRSRTLAPPARWQARSDNGLVLVVVLDQRGLAQLPVGTWTLTEETGAWRTLQPTVEVRSGERSDCACLGPARLELEVLDRVTGAPLAGAQVSVRFLTQEQAMWQVVTGQEPRSTFDVELHTDAAGRLALDQPELAWSDLHVRHAGHLPIHRRLDGDLPGSLTLHLQPVHSSARALELVALAGAQPLEGVEVSMGGALVGETDSEGRLAIPDPAPLELRLELGGRAFPSSITSPPIDARGRIELQVAESVAGTLQVQGSEARQAHVLVRFEPGGAAAPQPHGVLGDLPIDDAGGLALVLPKQRAAAIELRASDGSLGQLVFIPDAQGWTESLAVEQHPTLFVHVRHDGRTPPGTKLSVDYRSQRVPIEPLADGSFPVPLDQQPTAFLVTAPKYERLLLERRSMEPIVEGRLDVDLVPLRPLAGRLMAEGEGVPGAVLDFRDDLASFAFEERAPGWIVQLARVELVTDATGHFEGLVPDRRLEVRAQRGSPDGGQVCLLVVARPGGELQPRLTLTEPLPEPPGLLELTCELPRRYHFEAFDGVTGLAVSGLQLLAGANRFRTEGNTLEVELPPSATHLRFTSGDLSAELGHDELTSGTIRVELFGQLPVVLRPGTAEGLSLPTGTRLWVQPMRRRQLSLYASGAPSTPSVDEQGLVTVQLPTNGETTLLLELRGQAAEAWSLSPDRIDCTPGDVVEVLLVPKDPD
ncbi:MAG: hypothetical protein P1V81_05355 [Planctomycetota bacterium]|nr:hypothetical protein [Planctomycetota bacterium]